MVVDQVWRPLGVDTDEEVAEYDALHDGVPSWMATAYWDWVETAITYDKKYPGERIGSPWPEPDITESMCQQLRIPLSKIRFESADYVAGQKLIQRVMEALKRHDNPLQIADYLLAHKGFPNEAKLEAILDRSKSAWQVGVRQGRPGLVRRVPEGVQVAADDIMSQSGQAGIRLAKAWEQIYGVNPDPSGAYRSAIQAVEDAAIPVVSPKDATATLGKILGQIERDTQWRLPMEREHDNAPSREVLVGMMRMLWHGQHDRHGGQLSAPDELSVTMGEATVAVSLALTLVNLFDAGLVAHESKS